MSLPRPVMRATIALVGAAVAATLVAAPAAADTPAQVAAQAAKRPAGCGQAAPQQPGTSARHTIQSGGRDRTYQLHLPADYNPHRPYPLIVAYHGRGNTGAGTEEFSKLSTLPAVVAYPDGVIGTGDGDRQAWQGAPYSAPGVDDVAFTNDLLDRLEATVCVDDRRVYATGKSNGAGFTGILACRLADRIAAIAPVAGAFYPTGEDCRPSRPVPVIELHGTADATIPYPGDADRGLPAIPDWVAAWAKRDGCRVQTPPKRIEPDITTTRWVGCSRGAEVQHVAVDNGGHTWPGADIYSGGGVTTQTIEAHEVIWDFLRSHVLVRP
ncbi:alpha/beta hydrolase family esterase [Pseudonocardia sp. TRM90224]|uniref:alpha/beta hydrolase family esterase n=1 Tax=Pseudonocardia sp. TRM90224 TaxID=2812678 RepID=UPI001E51C3EC|nr:PHB depolymerase family esterase [Pseudonocardia sp. TRM90224]